jgi:dTDP-4-amino-4,6-dideoxygalactose transaminase
MESVTEFENTIAEYFGAPCAVATDSCTHAVELALRLLQPKELIIPAHTYLSIPMTAVKLNIPFKWRVDSGWTQWYRLGDTKIIDAATFWKKDGYISCSYMCLSFQFKKHLNLGRGGVILTDNPADAELLRKMAYDGRSRDNPWAEQDVSVLGYHYYMTPETAQLGLEKLQQAKQTEARIWSYTDYPDLRKMKVFENIQEYS